MKTKFKLTNRILSLVLALVMIIGMLPMTTLTAFAASASVPAVDGNHIYANGTPLYIVAGTTSGTAVYYMSGSQKVYVNTNGAAGNDLSNTIVWGGYDGNALDGDVNITMTGGKVRRINGSGYASDTKSGYVNNVNITISGGTVTDDVNAGWRNPVKGNVNITMTGGSVGKIYGCCAFSQASVGNSDVKVHGNVNITITGGAVSQVHGGDGYHPVNGTVSGLITVPVSFLNYSTLGSDLTVSFDNLLYKSGSNYIHRGTVTIPAGVTMTVAAGETLTVPVNATLINNGTIVNNGTMILNGPVRGNAITGSGNVIRNAVYVPGITSNTGVSIQVNGVEQTKPVELTNNNLYAYVPAGTVKITVNGTDYYGVYSGSGELELTSSYVSASGFAGIPGSIFANKSVTLSASVGNTTLTQILSYELVDAGNTGAVLNDATLTAYGAGTVKVKVTAQDYYSTYSEEFSIGVTHIPVTALDGAVPTEGWVGSNISLPTLTVSPADASYQTIVWSVVDAGSTGATMNGSTLRAISVGTATIRASIEHGTAYGTAYTKDYTVTFKATETIDVSMGSVTIVKKDEQTLTVQYAPFNGGSKDYALGEPIYITGTTSSNTVTIESGAVADIIIGSLNISSSNGNPFYVKNGANVTLTLKNSNSFTTSDSDAAALRVPAGAVLTIDGDGSLTADSSKGGGFGAGIGGESDTYGETGGTIIILGGTVTAKSDSGAGIGGGAGQYSNGVAGNGGNITVSGGNVTAASFEGAGIGGGSSSYHLCGSGGTIHITGGTVTATSYFGAGIGGGGSEDGSSYKGTAGEGGTITISGGTVTASSTNRYGGAGIGSGGTRYGTGNSGGTITITGGTVKATTAVSNGEAIGKGYNGTSSGTLQDGNGNAVTLYTFILSGAGNANVTVQQGLGSYGVNDVKTQDTDKLYFYLPAESVATSFTAGGNVYDCTADNQTYYASHDWSNNDGVCARCGEDCGHENQTGSTCELCGKALHTHNWTYAKDGSKITATCDAVGCPNTDGGSGTLNVTDAYYTGSAIGATVSGSFTNGATYKVTYNDGSETAPSSVGTHKATLTVYENGNEKQNVTAQYKISYLPAPHPAYAISGAYENNGTYWFKTGATVTVKAPSGYTISTALDGTYGESVAFSAGDDMVIYLKDEAGAMTDAIDVEVVRFDGNGATGEITIENRGFWEKLFNKITFGLFFKGDAVAKVSAMDDESGVQSIQYYVADEDLINDGDTSVLETAIGNNWKDYSNEIALNKNAKNVIYVKITDNVGNVTYISSDGIVLYSDAEAVTESVSTTYKAGADKDVTVELNGNTVNAITNGDDVLAGADYSVSANGTITLKASYLDTLSVGTYTFTVSYNPLGENFVGAPSNDAPKTTTFKVVVEKAEGKVSNINISGKTYDGTAVTSPTFDKLGDGAATIEYKVKGAEDSTYTTTAPKNAGDYIVRVTVAEGTNHKAVSATAEFAIDKVALTVTADAKSKTYGEGDPALTWSITSGALVNGEQLTGIVISRVSGENANTYAITVSQAEGANKNYDITFVGGTFTIHAKTVDATVVVNGAPFTYNGGKQEPEIVVKDGDTVIPANEYEVSYSSNTNAGTATVIVTDKDGGNYVVNGTTTFIINKATPVIGTVGVDGVVKDSTKPSEVVLTRTDTTVDGVLKLTDDAMLANKATYRWVFTPADTDNYNVINGDVQIDVLDTVLPTAVIKVDTNEWKQFINNITFGLFFKETQEVTITAVDNENGSGIKDIVYFVSNLEYESDELRYVEWKSYTEAFDIEPDGKFVIYAKVTDNDGNAVIINSDGVVVDETAAVVSGITDGEIYYGQLVFTVTDELAGVKSVVIDGNDKTHVEGQYVINGDNAEHTVVVTDNAGNVTEYKVTVYKNHTVTYKADGEPISTETVGHGKDATLPAVPAKDGYVGKWDSDGKNITEDTTISVVYTEIPVVKPNEVKPEDKTDLEDTKKQFEDMLDDDSYTDDDKKDIQEAIDDIDDALEVIGKVEAVEELIDKLPDTIKKDDEAAIKTADDAYNALTDYEKSLVDKDAKKALDDAKAALAELNKPADSTAPGTGDNSNMMLWIALLFISGGAVIMLTVVDRKRKTVKR